MTTIATTWRQLQNLCKHKSGIDICHHPRRKRSGDEVIELCEHKENCPIWKRAERKAMLKKDLVTIGKRFKSVDDLINFFHDQDKNAAKSKLVFGPVGRSGTPLVKDGKIVRLEKKRSTPKCLGCCPESISNWSQCVSCLKNPRRG